MVVVAPIIFSPPASLYLTAMAVLYVVSSVNGGLSEIKGKNVLYSKFWNPKMNENVKGLASRHGMVLAYTPAFLAALASFWLLPREGLRFLLLASALTLHFFKRVFESLFIHKYSGKMASNDAVAITLIYLITTINMIYAQHLTQGSEEPVIDLKYLGVVVFMVGISGNLYHHCILSKLRKDEGDKEYKIPKGGLFGWVVCPHYLFEILGFVGISFIAQTLYAWSFTIGSTFFLMGRSYATRRWYFSKFEDFPKHVKALFPFVF